MNVRSYQSSCWDCYKHKDNKVAKCYNKKGEEFNYYRYKLHISISPQHFHLVEAEINQILQNAIQNQVIPSYKCLNFQRIGKHNVRRLINLPFAIYLPNDCNQQQLNAIVEMCKQIETVLQKKKIPRGDDRQLSGCDVRLPGHFTFRQTAIKTEPPYEYLAAEDETTINQLRDAGLESDYFKKIKLGLSVVEDSLMQFVNVSSESKEQKTAEVKASATKVSTVTTRMNALADSLDLWMQSGVNAVAKQTKKSTVPTLFNSASSTSSNQSTSMQVVTEQKAERRAAAKKNALAILSLGTSFLS